MFRHSSKARLLAEPVLRDKSVYCSLQLQFKTRQALTVSLWPLTVSVIYKFASLGLLWSAVACQWARGDQFGIGKESFLYI